MKINVANIIAAVVGVLTIIGFMFAADARYVKNLDLDSAKNEIISEMRREVARNRAILIGSLQRSADDIEFQMSEYETRGETVPRFLKEKHRQLKRLVVDLQKVDKT